VRTALDHRLRQIRAITRVTRCQLTFFCVAEYPARRALRAHESRQQGGPGPVLPRRHPQRRTSRRNDWQRRRTRSAMYYNKIIVVMSAVCKKHHKVFLPFGEFSRHNQKTSNQLMITIIGRFSHYRIFYDTLDGEWFRFERLIFRFNPERGNSRRRKTHPK
jgi:hypothetical protein